MKMDFEVIKYDGELYVAMGWNGEYYSNCYKHAPWCGLNNASPADGWENKSIALKPIYKEVGEDEFEIVGYEEC